MEISLIGYMGAGKTTIGQFLSNKLNLPLIDLDNFIEEKESMPISDIFKNKGEIYFRKKENQYLKELLEKENFILSTGGGTPVFYDNMDLINNSTIAFYLQNSPVGLAERLAKEKSKRPLISHLKDEDLIEFIAKHLFERNPFYQKAKHTIFSQNKSVEEISDEILTMIKTHQNQS